MQTRQLWLDLAPKGGAYRRDTFVEGRSNALARKALKAWREWPGGILALTGPMGCGKSHLAALWAQENGGHKLELNNLPRNIQGCVLIEDLPEAMHEQNLFRLINNAAQGAVHVLLTSAVKPRQWPVHMPDLPSRLVAMHNVVIEEPDDVVLSGVLKKLFADRQIAVDHAVIDYLLTRMERSTAAALTTVERIHAKGHDQRQNIRLPLVRAVMTQIEQEEHPNAQGK
ncbi:MAG: hypothetical protein COA85_01220 [Robiginitomaculum sp.]|nr:MAG: hypothetical protein COA85_01220 [Robiginitomaculum sp.]